MLSRLIHRLRAVLPPEVTGVIVTMVGLSLVGPGVENLSGVGLGDPLREPGDVIVGLSTLALIFSLTVWGSGVFRLYCVLAGILFGYALSYAFGVIPQSHIDRFLDSPMLSVPSFQMPASLEFEWLLLVPFLVAGLASSIKAVGDLSTAQKINDENWVTPDMQSIKGGVLADALAVTAAGLLGGMGQSTSSSNVGISLATGVTSRMVAYSAGVIFILAAFVPALAYVFVLMPTPVKGAVLIFAACFMIIAGLQLVMTRLMDARKTFVVGASMIAGLSVDILPGLYTNLPAGISSLATSSLSLATTVAILLNLVFRIGVSREAEITIRAQDPGSEKVVRFLTMRGGEWGARRDIITKAATALLEVVEAVEPGTPGNPGITVKTQFDEFLLKITVHYPGAALPFPEKSPDPEQASDNPDYWREVSGAIISSVTDELTQTRVGNENVLSLNFHH
jgi:xanthine permease XanP